MHWCVQPFAMIWSEWITGGLLAIPWQWEDHLKKIRYVHAYIHISEVALVCVAQVRCAMIRHRSLG
jgi:hypothetical protein